MNYITACEGKTIPIGKQGENLTTIIKFPIHGWAKLFGEGIFMLYHSRHGDTTAYPCGITKDDGYVYWTVTSSDTQYDGDGSCELVYTIDDAIAKSVIYKTHVDKSLNATDAPPAPWQSWINSLSDIVEDASDEADRAEDAADRAEEAIRHAPMIGENGNWWIWDTGTQDYEDSTVSARPEFVIVEEELPEVGEGGLIYLLPYSDPSIPGEENDSYQEYVWLNSQQWEMIGTTKIDLSGYATMNWAMSWTENYVQDQLYLTDEDITGKLDSSNISHETWFIDYADGTSGTKEVVLWNS